MSSLQRKNGIYTLTEVGNELFFNTYTKWLQNQNIHTQLIVTRVFDNNAGLYISNGQKRVRDINV